MTFQKRVKQRWWLPGKRHRKATEPATVSRRAAETGYGSGGGRLGLVMGTEACAVECDANGKYIPEQPATMVLVE